MTRIVIALVAGLLAAGCQTTAKSTQGDAARYAFVEGNFSKYGVLNVYEFETGRQCDQFVAKLSQLLKSSPVPAKAICKPGGDLATDGFRDVGMMHKGSVKFLELGYGMKVFSMTSAGCKVWDKPNSKAIAKCD